MSQIKKFLLGFIFCVVFSLAFFSRTSDVQAACSATGSLSYQCNGGYPNIKIYASWDVPYAGNTCNIFLNAGGVDTNISNSCTGKNVEISQINGQPITRDATVALYVSNGDTGPDGCFNVSPSGGTTTVNCALTAPPCDPNQVNMSISPNPGNVGGQMTFNTSGNQGSTWPEDSWTGGVDCNGSFWGSKNCNVIAGGNNFTWTHKWKNCATNNCSVTSAQCSKSASYNTLGNASTPTPDTSKGSLDCVDPSNCTVTQYTDGLGRMLLRGNIVNWGECQDEGVIPSGETVCNWVGAEICEQRDDASSKKLIHSAGRSPGQASIFPNGSTDKETWVSPGHRYNYSFYETAYSCDVRNSEFWNCMCGVQNPTQEQIEACMTRGEPINGQVGERQRRACGGKLIAVKEVTAQSTQEEVVQYRFAETVDGLNSVPWQDWTAGTATRTFDYSFQDKNPGLKHIYAQYKTNNGRILPDNKPNNVEHGQIELKTNITVLPNPALVNTNVTVRAEGPITCAQNPAISSNGLTNCVLSQDPGKSFCNGDFCVGEFSCTTTGVGVHDVNFAGQGNTSGSCNSTTRLTVLSNVSPTPTPFARIDNITPNPAEQTKRVRIDLSGSITCATNMLVQSPALENCTIPLGTCEGFLCTGNADCDVKGNITPGPYPVTFTSANDQRCTATHTLTVNQRTFTTTTVTTLATNRSNIVPGENIKVRVVGTANCAQGASSPPAVTSINNSPGFSNCSQPTVTQNDPNNPQNAVMGEWVCKAGNVAGDYTATFTAANPDCRSWDDFTISTVPPPPVTPSPTLTPTPTVTITPPVTITPVNFNKYQISETIEGLNSAQLLDYPNNPLTITYTFSSTPGQKQLCARFKDIGRNVFSEPFCQRITLSVGPTPTPFARIASINPNPVNTNNQLAVQTERSPLCPNPSLQSFDNGLSGSCSLLNGSGITNIVFESWNCTASSSPGIHAITMTSGSLDQRCTNTASFTINAPQITPLITPPQPTPTPYALMTLSTSAVDRNGTITASVRRSALCSNPQLSSPGFSGCSGPNNTSCSGTDCNEFWNCTAGNTPGSYTANYTSAGGCFDSRPFSINNPPPAQVPERTVKFRVSDSQGGLDSASDQNYTSEPMVVSHTFSSTPGLKTLWVRFFSNRGNTRDERQSITLSPVSCRNISITGATLGQTPNSSGGPIYTIDATGGNLPIVIDRVPTTADADVSCTPNLTVNKFSNQSGITWTAVVPPNEDTVDKSYTCNITVRSGEFSDPCKPVDLVVRKPSSCRYESTEIRVRKNDSDPWVGSVTIQRGQSVQLAAFHNSGSILAPADEVKWNVTGPNRVLVTLEGNNVTYTPPLSGQYSVRVLTKGQAGSECTDTANFIVEEGLTPTPGSISCSAVTLGGRATDSGEINDFQGRIYNLESNGGAIPVNIDRRPANADVELSVSPVLTVNKRGTGSEALWTAIVPANTDTTQSKRYEMDANVRLGSDSAQCLRPASLVVKSPVACQSQIRSTEVRFKKNNRWVSAPQTINKGEKITVAGFHNGNTDQMPDDIILKAIDSEGGIIYLQGNNIEFTPDIASRFTITAETTGQIGQNCIGQNELTVRPLAPATRFYRVAETRQGLDTAPDRPYDNPARQNPVEISYTFSDQTPGVKWLFVRFIDFDGNVRDSQQKITLIPPDPEIDNIVCSFTPDGKNTLVKINGQNFGSHDRRGRGNVRVNNKLAIINSWNGTSSSGLPLLQVITSTGSASQVNAVTATQSTIEAVAGEKIEGVVPVVLTIDDGRTVIGSCAVNTTTVGFAVKTQCGGVNRLGVDQVEAYVIQTQVPGAKPLQPKQKYRLDNEGRLQGFVPKLEVDKEYALVLKGPKTISKVQKFTAQDGSTELSDIILPVGDIYPAFSPDNTINSFDKAELVRQWNLVADTTKSGDFNGDSRVNSIDYSCLLINFNQRGENFDPPAR